MRIAFFGSSDFAIPSLKALAEGGFAPVLVVTKPDAPRGRGRKIYDSDVKLAAQEVGLVRWPRGMNPGACPPFDNGLQGKQLERDFLGDVVRNRHNAAILGRWGQLALPDAWLVAGCLFQSIWNLQLGRPPDAGIKGYDLFYFDPHI